MTRRPVPLPSLGLAVVAFIETYLCHGPGDLRGDPVVLDDELAAFVVKAYALDPVTGRRLVNRAFLSRAKGRAKSEVAAMLCCAELLGPVRFDHWDDDGRPVGRPVRDPFIRCLATEEGQSGNTYDGVVVQLAHLVEHFGSEFPKIDVGLTRTFVAGGGEVRPSTAASASKDGGKETFAVADETHLFVLPELRAMHDTVTRNLAKRRAAEPWMLETSTMYQPGLRSVAEATHEYAAEIAAGRLPGRGLLFDHREGPMPENWDDDDEMLDCLRHAYGQAAWMDFDRILAEIRDPKTSKASAARYFLNRATAEAEQWVTPAEWEPLARPGDPPPAGVAVALGFDGSESDDATGLVGCSLETGHLFVLGCWRAPEGATGWTVPRQQVAATVAGAFNRWRVAIMLADPPYWRTELAEWAATYGDRTVVEFPTASWSRMSRAVERLTTAIRAGAVSHDGDRELAEHVANARCAVVNPRRPELGFVLVKDRRNSPRKIDLAVASVLAFEARDLAVAQGWSQPVSEVIDLGAVMRRAAEAEGRGSR